MNKFLAIVVASVFSMGSSAVFAQAPKGDAAPAAKTEKKSEKSKGKAKAEKKSAEKKADKKAEAPKPETKAAAPATPATPATPAAPAAKK